jgi:hypothetical protein
LRRALPRWVHRPGRLRDGEAAPGLWTTWTKPSHPSLTKFTPTGGQFFVSRGGQFRMPFDTVGLATSIRWPRPAVTRRPITPAGMRSVVGLGGWSNEGAARQRFREMAQGEQRYAERMW